VSIDITVIAGRISRIDDYINSARNRAGLDINIVLLRSKAQFEY